MIPAGPRRNHPGLLSLDVDPAVPGLQFQALESDAGQAVPGLFDKGARDPRDGTCMVA